MLVFGFNIAPPLPQNLSAIGMPNCFQYCDVVATAALVTSATGVATYNLAIPSGPAFSGAILYEQYYVADPAANAAGALATNFGRVLTGF
jgi:hypothetical protein